MEIINFYKAKEDLGINKLLKLTLSNKPMIKYLIIYCSSFFTVFADDEVISFGPDRSPKGYCRGRRIEIPNLAKKICIKIIYYGIPTYDLDLDDFYISINAYDTNDNIICNTLNFKCEIDSTYLSESCKFSFQRGFVERYDCGNDLSRIVELEKTQPREILEINNDCCNYSLENIKHVTSGVFKGFSEIIDLRCQKKELFGNINLHNVRTDLISFSKTNPYYDYFSLNQLKSGLIKLSIISPTNEKVFILFDEYLPNNEWVLGRSDCCDFIEVNVKAGENTIISNVPYAFKHLLILKRTKSIRCIPSLVSIQNDEFSYSPSTGNKQIDKMLESCCNTFRQNSLDIFTDCPGRERAGWLCDSYFMGIAEKFFTGKNTIEKRFLENYILNNSSDIPQGMIPMCFPASHPDHNFIPNWALFFIIELKRYYDDTNDFILINKAKNVVDGILKYFLNFENEYCLLEDLEGWVFVEWSMAGSKEFVDGVSFPTNMLYSYALECAYEIYKDIELHKKAEKIKSNVIDFSFDGKYFHDNAYRDDNSRLITFKDHISETCQYYALFFNIYNEKQFALNMINNFSMSKNNDENIKKSNVFIGNYLRMFWLLSIGKKNKVLQECLDYFAKMCDDTETIWELDKPSASCCHGFGSCLAYILTKAIC